MSRNFDDYSSFQPKTTRIKHFCPECIRSVNAETFRRKDLKYVTHDLCVAQISHSSLVQKIHALVAMPLDAGILCTSDLCEIQNTLLIIRDSLRSSSHDIVGYLLPATRH